MRYFQKTLFCSFFLLPSATINSSSKISSVEYPQPSSGQNQKIETEISMSHKSSKFNEDLHKFMKMSLRKLDSIAIQQISTHDYDTMTLSQKYRILESITTEKKPFSESPQLLIQCSPQDFSDLSLIHPIKIDKHWPKQNLYLISVPAWISLWEYKEKILQFRPSIRAETDQKQIPEPSLDDSSQSDFQEVDEFLNQISDKQKHQIPRVCILDSGLFNHPDLPGIPGISRDESGHGTHVTGIMAAIRHNGIGINGLSPFSTYRFYKITKEKDITLIQTVSSLIQAKEDQCQIINMSFGFEHFSGILNDVLSDLAQNGILLIAAAGNSATNKPVQPASHPFVIGVGSLKNIDTPSSFSNFGDNLSISLPGEEILSLWIDGGTKRQSGTSMASPIFASIMANLYALEKKSIDIPRFFEAMRDYAIRIKNDKQLSHIPFIWKEFENYYRKGWPSEQQ